MDLRVPSRANLIDAIQRLRVSAHEGNAEYVCDIFQRTVGYNLTKLKLLIDNKGNIHNLHKLVWMDMVGEHRTKLIQHFTEQARMTVLRRRQRDELLGRKSRRLRKILSDVDDTVRRR